MMCGIAGFAGTGDVVKRTIEGLRRLEYRGYDSAGVAYASGGELIVLRCRGTVAELSSRLRDGRAATAAIAHTRWATHGAPTEENAHPHSDCSCRLAIVHNGIIENHAELRVRLQERGHRFRSETDTEVIAHLLEERLGPVVTVEALATALREVAGMLTGSYAVAVVCRALPDTIVALRHESPLLVGMGEHGTWLASDLPALVGCADRMAVLENGDLAVVRPHAVQILGRDGRLVERTWQPITLDRGTAEKGGYPHFMLKEIHENPEAVTETLRGRAGADGRVELVEIPAEILGMLRDAHVHFVACGTAYHACLFGQRLLRTLMRKRAEATVASEFRYDDPIVDEGTLVVLISQSGETADTLAAAREAKRRGARTLAIVNCAGSSLAREADAVLLTRAGPEIGVASTKAYIAQVTALALLGSAVGADGFARDLLKLPVAIRQVLSRSEQIEAIAERLASSKCFFFLGRGYDAAVAAEAALKLKEISYIHAEAYPAGEMKHGPLALIEPGVAVVGICTRHDTHAKMASNLMEARARSGTVFGVVSEDLTAPEACDMVFRLPTLPEPLMPAVSMTALQLFAYYMARNLGCPIDQPRNLAKSVTVE